MAPANIRDPRMGAALLHFAARYAHGLPAKLDIALPDTPPTTAEELRHVEATHQVCLVVQVVGAQAPCRCTSSFHEWSIPFVPSRVSSYLQ